ncbi:MAG TPA: tetratricopeptide repeat protein, partial [Thermoanaerobaculia bacterium]|nr:tetratricopeptide repeat protein [Thermoanaerobaculia bacterium]
ALVLAVAAAAAPRVSATELPPIPCVEAVRAARIATERGDADMARKGLEAAVDLPGCELPALAGILPLLRAGAYPADRAAALGNRLTARLEDPAVEVPDGLLTQLALITAGDDEDLLLATLERRLAREPAVDAKPPHPGLAELLEITAELQARRGKPEAARENLARLLALQPSVKIRWRALKLDVLLERWASAEQLLTSMLAEPEAPLPLLRNMQVQVLASLGRFDDMMKAIEGVAPPAEPADEAAPPSILSEVLLDAAWALRHAGRDADAERIFRRVLANEPGQPEAQLALLHFYGTAEERAAQAAAVAARRATESDPLALFEEGSNLLGAGDAAGARDLLARAAPQLRRTDYAEPAWYNLGNAAFKLERWEEAATALGEAIAVNPSRAESHYKRGIALFHLERCPDAVAALARTLELQADKRDAHYYLAGCYTKLGDAAAAAREDALFNAKP